MKDAGLERSALIKAIKELRGGSKVTDQNAESKYKSLERYSKNLNDLAKQGKIDPVIGRDEEIRRVFRSFQEGQKTIRSFWVSLAWVRQPLLKVWRNELSMVTCRKI